MSSREKKKKKLPTREAGWEREGTGDIGGGERIIVKELMLEYSIPETQSN